MQVIRQPIPAVHDGLINWDNKQDRDDRQLRKANSRQFAAAWIRKIRLELAREPDHPEGDSNIAYTLIAPLDPASRLDLETWKDHREAARVVRERPGEPDQAGHLIRTRNGAWAFHYDAHGNTADETGYRFADEKFTLGEYVSVVEDGKPHAFKVISVARL